jgi:hypothetical protein
MTILLFSPMFDSIRPGLSSVRLLPHPFVTADPHSPTEDFTDDRSYRRLALSASDRAALPAQLLRRSLHKQSAVYRLTTTVRELAYSGEVRGS